MSPETILAVIEGKGRVLLAAREFAEEECIFTESPLAMASDLLDACPLCSPLQQLSPQLRHHATACPSHSPFLRLALALDAISSATGVSMPSLRLLLSILSLSTDTVPILLNLEPGFKLVEEGKTSETAQARDQLKERCLSAAEKVWACLDESSVNKAIASAETVALLLGVIQCNAHALDVIKGKGVSPHTAMLEHSCNPSAYLVSSLSPDGAVQIQLKAGRRIARGEALSIRYLAAYTSTEARRDYLRDNYIFICSCASCLGPDLARVFACPNDGCRGVVCPRPTHSGVKWVCANLCGSLRKCCGQEAGPSAVKDWLRGEDSLRQRLREGPVEGQTPAQFSQSLHLLAQASGLHKAHFLVPNSKLHRIDQGKPSC